MLNLAQIFQLCKICYNLLFFIVFFTSKHITLFQRHCYSGFLILLKILIISTILSKVQAKNNSYYILLSDFIQDDEHSDKSGA